MRYWISRQPGEVEGPFDIDTLNQMREAGTLSDATQVCPEGSESWQPFSTVDPGGTGAPPTSQEVAGSVVADRGASLLAQKRYSIEYAFSIGWTCLRNNYGLLLGIVAMMTILKVFIWGLENGTNLLVHGPEPVTTTPVTTTPETTTPQTTAAAAMWHNTSRAGTIVNSILEWLVFTPYGLGSVMVIVRTLRGESTSWAETWCGFRGFNYGRILLLQLCWLALMILFMIALGITFGLPAWLLSGGNATDPSRPGMGLFISLVSVGVAIGLAIWIFFYLRWACAGLLLIDPRYDRPSVIDSFKGSWRITRGGTTIGSLFILGVLSGLILVASFAMCFLPGIFLGGPYFIAIIATTYALLVQSRAPFGT